MYIYAYIQKSKVDKLHLIGIDTETLGMVICVDLCLIIRSLSWRD